MAKRYAILLGVEEYDEFDRTRYCHRDVDLVKETLTSFLDYAEQDVLATKLSLQVPSSPAAILESIEKKVAGAEAGDTVLFYFAGHGDRIGDQSFLLLPHSREHDYDRTALPLRDVTNRLRRDGIVNVRIFDACRSGDDARSPSLNDPAGFVRAVADSAKQEGWLTLASCNESQKSYADATLKHGIFTHYLCESIRQVKEGKPVKSADLFSAVAEKVEAHADKTGEVQSPVLSGHMRGNLVLGVRRNPPKAVEAPQAKAAKPLEARLAALRDLPKIGSEEHKKMLEDAFSAALKTFGDAKGKLELHGRSLHGGEPQEAKALRAGVRRAIVGHIVSRQFKSCHNVSKARRKHPFGIAAAFLAGDDIEYELDQDYQWPRSTAIFTVPSDSLLPQAMIFLYVCPLQTGAILFAGYAISDPLSDIADGDLKFWAAESPLPVPDTCGKRELETLCAAFNKDFARALEHRLEYLEREREAMQRKKEAL